MQAFRDHDTHVVAMSAWRIGFVGVVRLGRIVGVGKVAREQDLAASALVFGEADHLVNCSRSFVSDLAKSVQAVVDARFSLPPVWNVS